MHEEVLPGGTKSVLARLKDSGVLGDAYLAGGTAVALQLGHRISEDLDFFLQEKFDEQKLFNELVVLGFQSDFEDWQTINGYIEDVKFSYFHYPYPLLFPRIDYGGVLMASLQDIACMKTDAIGRRAKKRDFIDLYVILQSLSCTLFDVFSWYGQKYEAKKDAILHGLRSLEYFVEVDRDDTPLRMLQHIEWKDVKAFFTRETQKTARMLLE